MSRRRFWEWIVAFEVTIRCKPPERSFHRRFPCADRNPKRNRLTVEPQREPEKLIAYLRDTRRQTAPRQQLMPCWAGVELCAKRPPPESCRPAPTIVVWT